MALQNSTVLNNSEGVYTGLAFPDQAVYSAMGQTSHNSRGAQLTVSTEKSGQSSHPYRLTVVCLGLLCVLLLTAIIVQGVLLSSHSKELRANGCNCSNEKIMNEEEGKELSEETITFLEVLGTKLPNLNRYCPLISRKRVCRPCPRGWEQFYSKCYYFSTQKSDWEFSRRDCFRQGADLVIIESKEEQDFIFKHTTFPSWIGLSDFDTDGTWFWVDGTPLQKDKEFWGSGVSDGKEVLFSKHGALYTDCAVTLPGLNEWAKSHCYSIQNSVCETDALLP